MVQSCVLQEEYMAYAIVHAVKHVLRCHMIALPYVSCYLGRLVTASAPIGTIANCSMVLRAHEASVVRAV